jgi:L-threonylcarbamoyladenylate synthase
MPVARIVSASEPGAVERASAIIRNGGLVAFPTETVYGLGADAENPQAVARIFEVKARPRMDPLIVHVADLESASRYGFVPSVAEILAKRFWPGPLTLVLVRKPSIPPIVTAGLDTVAIRVPAHTAALDLIRASKCGIAAPSANLFGYVSPTQAGHVVEQLGSAIDLILDGGTCTIGVESTIVSLADSVCRILRVGGTPVEEIEALIGKVEIEIGDSGRPQAPGQMKRHYSTRTPLEIADESTEAAGGGKKIGLLSLLQPPNPRDYAAVEILSPSGSLREAAANLFGALRRLDSLSLDKIVARPVKEEGLGRAIMDRLRRCSVRD